MNINLASVKHTSAVAHHAPRHDAGHFVPGLVSVIICCRNGENYLAEAIESILAQTYSRLEILLIDNDSTDSTAAIAAQYPQVRYLHHDNQGLVRSRNRGIAESRGQYLVYLDHDDRLLPHALEVGVQSLTEQPDCGFVFGCGCYIRSNGSLAFYESYQLLQLYEPTYDYATLLRGPSYIVPQAAAMFRRDVLIEVGGYAPEAGKVDDFEIYLRISRQFPIYFHRQLVAEYRLHPNSQTTRHALQTQQDVLNVIAAQQPYVQDNPAYAAAYEQSKVTWAYSMTISTLQKAVTQILRGQWRTVWRDRRSIIRSPIFFNCWIICQILWGKRLIFQMTHRPVRSTAEFMTWVNQRQRTTNLRQ